MAFMFLDEYPAYPLTDGTCFACRASRRPNDRVIDLGRTYDEITDLDGVVHSFKSAVICETCVVELAHMIGSLTPEKTRELGERLIAAEDERDQLRNQLHQAAAQFLEGITS